MLDFKTELQGFENHINSSPSLTENEKTANTENEYEQAEGKAIADGIDNFLRLEQTQQYQTSNFLLEKSESGDISISVNNEKIFTAAPDGNIENQLNADQAQNFLEFAAKVDDVANERIHESVEKFLDFQEKDHHGTTNYFFERSSEGEVSVTSKETGEEVFKATSDGSIETSLNPEEVKKFLDFADQVDEVVMQKEQSNSQVER